jgi:hypothetical protein
MAKRADFSGGLGLPKISEARVSLYQKERRKIGTPR